MTAARVPNTNEPIINHGFAKAHKKHQPPIIAEHSRRVFNPCFVITYQLFKIYTYLRVLQVQDPFQLNLDGQNGVHLTNQMLRKFQNSAHLF